MLRATGSIPSHIDRYRRAGLIQAPIIIHPLPRLSSHLGHGVYMLRDDLTGFGLGGNKTRKLDYLVGDALAKNATALATIKATSFSRNAAAAAAACGLELHVVLPGREADQNPLSQALFRQMGTRLHYEARGPDALASRLDRIVAALEEAGTSVYGLHPGGSDAIGALSYVRVLHEILEFSNRTGVHFSHVIHSTSSAGTQAGIVVGQCISGYDARIVGICASLVKTAQAERVRALAASTAQMIGACFDPARVVVDDGFVGPGYGEALEAGEAAAGLFAKLEGVLLDPVYTGKAAAALLDYVVEGKFGSGNVLFIHTGGNAGLYY